jgi:hypothetical protein
MSQSTVSHNAAIAIIFLAMLMACSEPKVIESEFLRGVLSRKVGLSLRDSISLLLTRDSGIDLHGSKSVTYVVTVTRSDFVRITGQLEQDSTHEWVGNLLGNYFTTVYPDDNGDTIFHFAVVRSNSTIDITIQE